MEFILLLVLIGAMVYGTYRLIRWANKRDEEAEKPAYMRSSYSPYVQPVTRTTALPVARTERRARSSVSSSRNSVSGDSGSPLFIMDTHPYNGVSSSNDTPSHSFSGYGGGESGGGGAGGDWGSNSSDSSSSSSDSGGGDCGGDGGGGCD